MFRRLQSCTNVDDMRLLAKQRLPGPIFHYIDGAADDEVTYRRNTAAFEECDLVPNVLVGVENIDMSVTVMDRKLAMPIFCSPTALQRLFHHDGERAVARAAEKFGTMFGVSSLGTVSVEEIGAMTKTPKMFQLYFHKDRGLTNAMIERVKEAKFDAIALTVDTITGGNRERDLRTGFTSPPRLTLSSLVRRSRRTITLGATALEALRQHRVRQAEERLRLGPAYEDHGLVCAKLDGLPMSPRDVSKEFSRVASRLGFKVRFHDLRHTHISHMLAEGVHPKIASERAGHASIAITLDVYSHVMSGLQEDAANRVDATLQRALAEE